MQLLTLTLMLSLLLWTPRLPAQGSESDAQEAQPLPQERTRVLYIEKPIAIADGVDPVLPEPPFRAAAALATQGARGTTTISEYANRVAQIEGRGGAWDQALVEQLVSQGLLQQGLNDHLEAIETLDRALHINRINSGLHTLEQVPVVEAMIDSYKALGDWQNVDQYQNYLYFVQHKSFGLEDPRIIPVLDRLANWNIEAFTLGFGDPLGARLASAQLMFSAAKRMVDVHFGRDDERFAIYLRSVAKSSYLAALFPEYMVELDLPEYRTSQQHMQDMLQERRGVSPRAFARGEEALQEIIDHQEQAGSAPETLARALVDLADWNLLFERRITAQELYSRAWNLLAEQDNGEELLAAFFGQVVAIPTFADLTMNVAPGFRDNQSPSTLAYDTVDVQLDVTDYGAPRDVEILSPESPTNASRFAQLRRELRRIHYRPLVVAGELIAAENQRFRVRYWY